MAIPNVLLGTFTDEKLPKRPSKRGNSKIGNNLDRPWGQSVQNFIPSVRASVPIEMCEFWPKSQAKNTTPWSYPCEVICVA